MYRMPENFEYSGRFVVEKHVLSCGLAEFNDVAGLEFVVSRDGDGFIVDMGPVSRFKVYDEWFYSAFRYTKLVFLLHESVLYNGMLLGT